MSSVRPIGKFILAKKIEKENKTTSTGLYIASDFEDSSPTAEVIEVGNGYFAPYSEWVELPIKKGDIIAYIDGHTKPFKQDDEEFIFLNFDSIIAIIENKERGEING